MLLYVFAVMVMSSSGAFCVHDACGEGGGLMSSTLQNLHLPNLM